MTDRTVYEFGGYRFEPFNARLLCHGQAVPITTKASQTLELLLKNVDVLVTKEELLAAVWPDAAVEENNLAQQIHLLRRVLSLDGAAVKIETVPRRGYRLVGPIQRIPPNGAPAFPAALPATLPLAPDSLAGPGAAEASPRTAPSKRPAPWLWRFAAMVAVLSAGVSGGWPIYQQWQAGRESREATERGDALARQGDPVAAVAEYNAAIALNPSNAMAHGGLAWALQDAANAPSSVPRAIADSPSVLAATQSAALDPSCGLCRGTAGFFLFYHAWRFAEAEVHFREALRLAPDEFSIRPSYAMLLAVTGRPEEALRQVDMALEREPTRLSWLNVRASALYYARRYEEALAAADRVLLVDPRDRGGWDWRSRALFQLGRPEEAIRAISEGVLDAHTADLERAVTVGGVNAGLARALELTGDWRAVVAQSWRRADWYARLGHTDGALDELERAVDSRRFNAINLGADPVYDAIRPHPRFRALLDRAGLTPWFPAAR